MSICRRATNLAAPQRKHLTGSAYLNVGNNDWYLVCDSRAGLAREKLDERSRFGI
jgi:hypothetical protein